MEQTTKDLWVLIETNEDGSARNVGLELLNPGRRLADGQHGKLVAVVIGYGIQKAVEEAGAYGADEIIVIDDPGYQRFQTDTYAETMVTLIRKYKPLSVLIGATPNGREAAPRISCRLGTGLTADCTAVDIDEETGNVTWTRPTFGGNLMAQIQCPDHRPQMGTVRPGVFKKVEPAAPHAKVIHEELPAAAENVRVKVLEVIREIGGEKVDLESAEIIVAGGRGVGGPAGFAPIRMLAEVLGGVVGASRAAVDSGWIPHAHQVGQTGKTVGPKLYIACGISGAIQHTAGISGSDIIVAINSDPNAPIFSMADYCVVGDLFEVIPAMIEEICKRKGMEPPAMDSVQTAPEEQQAAEKQTSVTPSQPPVWAGDPVHALHIEMIPPKHASKKLADDLALFREKFNRYMEHGFIASITDNAMANLAFQTTEVVEALDLKPYPDQVLIHLNTFHEKEELERILTTARKVGIRNFLCITGDGSDKMHKLLPEELEAEDVAVTTSVELIRYIRKHYPEFILGAAFNPYEPPEHEFAKLRRKIDAGAAYVITQPILGRDEQLDRLKKEYPDLPVITEIWMSKKLYLLSDIFDRPIPEDEPYDPFQARKDVMEAYPEYGNYLALLGDKTQYPLIEEEYQN